MRRGANKVTNASIIVSKRKLAGKSARIDLLESPSAMFVEEI
jgi:hypothetical protein